MLMSQKENKKKNYSFFYLFTNKTFDKMKWKIDMLIGSLFFFGP